MSQNTKSAQSKPGNAPKMKGGAASGVGRLQQSKIMKGKGK